MEVKYLPSDMPETSEDDAKHFGFLHHQTGKPIYGEKSRGFHSDLARRMGHKDADDALRKGHVRFTVGHNGNSTFEYDSANKKAKHHIAHFITRTPEAYGKVGVEQRYKDKTGTPHSHTYLFHNADDVPKTIHHTIREQEIDTGDGGQTVPNFDMIEVEDPHDVVPEIGLDDRLYTE